MSKLTIAFLILYFSSSCMSQVILKSTKQSSSKKMETLTVADDFQYQNFKNITFDLLLEDSAGEPIPKLLFSFHGIEKNGEEDVFYAGMTQPNGSIKVTLKVPNHFEKVEINFSKNKKTQSFNYPLDLPSSQHKLTF